MKRNSFFASCAMLSVVAAMALIAKTSRAVGAESHQPLLEVVIEAQRLVRHEVSRTSSGSPIELIQLTRRVDYGDLDLTKHSDVAELENRISAMADEACKQLADMFPRAAPDNPNCVKQAIAGGMKQAEMAIKAASK
jgi:UrcA family protein